MAQEPAQYVNKRKICPRCNNTAGITYMYLNNNKPDQPRYKCKGEHGCGDFFTFGGKIRAPRVVRPRPRQTSATPTAVVAADRRTGPARRGRPPLSERVTRQSGARESQETPATCARTEARTGARTVATRARTEARAVAAGTLAHPTTGALGLPRIPLSEQRESPFQSSVVSPVENPAVRGPIPITRVAGLMPGDVVDADERTASRTTRVELNTASPTAATVIAQAGDVTENWTKAVLGVSPYELAPASDGKRMKVMRIKYGGKESSRQFRA